MADNFGDALQWQLSAPAALNLDAAALLAAHNRNPLLRLGLPARQMKIGF
jgi:hypothetical protein